MLQEDRKLDYVGDSARVATELIARGSTREGDYAERRYREYVKLIKEAHVIDAVRGKDGFLFPVKDWGAMGEGWTVGLVWMEGPPRADLGRTYKPIEGHWYLWKEERWIALEDKRAKLPSLSLSGQPKTPRPTRNCPQYEYPRGYCSSASKTRRLDPADSDRQE